jgi:hypothetical protein
MQPAGRKRSNSLPNAVSPDGDASLIQENRKRSWSDFNPIAFLKEVTSTQQKGKVEPAQAETVKETPKETPEQLDKGAKKLSDFMLLDSSVLSIEGLFRISANKNDLDEFYNKLMTSPDDVDLAKVKESDPHLLTAAYKQIYREKNLFGDYAKEFDKVGRTINDNEQETVKLLKDLKDKLPPTSQKDLKELMQVLVKISENAEVNKMGPSNLGVVIGPNLCFTKDLQISVSLFTSGGKVVENFIKHYEAVFEK